MTQLVHLDIHPDLASPALRDALRPERPLWSPRQLRDLTASITADQATALHAIARYTEPDRWWARLALTRGVEVWLLTWLPGQGTEPHDHGGAAGSFTVLAGSVTEHHRYPGSPIRVQALRAGQGLGFGGARAHMIRNETGQPAATVHAYSPPLLPTREYRSLEEIR